MKVYLAALGCRLNQAELEDMARAFESCGQQVVDQVTDADRIIVNTCTVTHVADRKSRQMIRRLHRRNTSARIAVTGCYAQMRGDVLRDLEGVDLIISNDDKDRVAELVLQNDNVSFEINSAFSPVVLESGHTRAFVKIQDGCDNACSYCIVTVARGAQRSLHPDRVLALVRRRIREGYREVVLTGVHIGAYGRDSDPRGALPPEKGWSLHRLVKRILEETNIQRLRLSSLEPWDLTDELVSLWSDKRLCPHLHLPLQSGSDEMLSAMNRDYTTSYFKSLVDDLRTAIPDLALTTDVIVGFPGETDVLFDESASFIDEIAFTRLHVFRYSPRPGTEAVTLDDVVAPPIADVRAKALAALSRELQKRYHERFVGRELDVLFERRIEDGLWDGLSANYCRVRVESDGALRNRFGRVFVERADSSGLSGHLVQGE